MRMKSEEIYKRSCHVIPGGVNSPARSFKGLNMLPLVVSHAKGSIIVDEDGRRYIDFCGSWGALLHGHAPSFILDAVQKQMEKGSSYGMTTAIEAEMAHLISSSVPGVDKVRFTNSGTEAVMTAVRIARNATSRSLIVTFQGNYHGHADLSPTHALPFNDIEAFTSFMKERGREAAAVLVEAVPANMGVILPRKNFFDTLRKLTRETGSLLILDEVVTGFRIGGLKGAAKLFDIDADLLTFGKIIGGGFPIGAVGGKLQWMDLLAPLGPVFHAGTFAGNPISMGAGLASLKRASEPKFYEELDDKCLSFYERVEKCLGRRGHLSHIGSMFTLFFGISKAENRKDLDLLDLEMFKKFFVFLFEKGILLAPSAFEANFISTTHSEEELDYVVKVIEEFFQ